MPYETFFTTETPAGDFNDGSAISLGLAYYFAVDGWVYGHRFYGNSEFIDPDKSGVCTGSFWQVTTTDSIGGGTMLASKAYPPGATSGWNQILYDSPVAVTAGVPYRSVVHHPSGLYAATGGYFDTSDTTVGNVIGISREHLFGGVGNVFNGTYFEPSATPSSFPIATFNGGNYFVDVLFSTDAPGGDTGEAGRFLSFF